MFYTETACSNIPFLYKPFVFQNLEIWTISTDYQGFCLKVLIIFVCVIFFFSPSIFLFFTLLSLCAVSPLSLSDLSSDSFSVFSLDSCVLSDSISDSVSESASPSLSVSLLVPFSLSSRPFPDVPLGLKYHSLFLFYLGKNQCPYFE